MKPRVPGFLRPLLEGLAREAIRKAERFLGLDGTPDYVPPKRCPALHRGAFCALREGHDGRHSFRLSDIRNADGWRPEGPPAA